MAKEEVLVSLASGGGTTFEQNEIAIRQKRIKGITYGGLIVSDEVKAAGAVKKAQGLGIRWAVVDKERFRNDKGRVERGYYGKALDDQIKAFGATIVMQNGWLEKTPNIIFESRPKGRVLNQHPGNPRETPNTFSLQPHETAIQLTKLVGRNAGTLVAVHQVTPVMDGGEIAGSLYVPIYDGDSAEDLQKRALPAEYALQTEVLNNIARGELALSPQSFHALEPNEAFMIPIAVAHAKAMYPNG